MMQIIISIPHNVQILPIFDKKASVFSIESI